MLTYYYQRFETREFIVFNSIWEFNIEDHWLWSFNEVYNEKCDIWSLGIVAYELCCLKVPYEAMSIE